MAKAVSFYRGDGVTIKRDRRKQWNAHCTTDGIRRNGCNIFTVLEVYEPATVRIPAGLHPQWIVYDDGSGVFGVANAGWFTHKIPASHRMRCLATDRETSEALS
jgi:hypothetical protein